MAVSLSKGERNRGGDDLGKYLSNTFWEGNAFTVNLNVPSDLLDFIEYALLLALLVILSKLRM